eukprot:CAMPEP_0174262466 /NCGR_PEP_ID=MMETSP0439-20130205/12990_1 /TAXON_ID=0 /ORGANISM="Stereomyxa ramosa, Strain Chinc5" /LENGTH=70 /DNA_ID=CAMNT_0015347177 /DNA_START=11 /DNA_END=220 /DNA_ORIENTATION=-
MAHRMRSMGMFVKRRGMGVGVVNRTIGVFPRRAEAIKEEEHVHYERGKGELFEKYEGRLEEDLELRANDW